MVAETLLTMATSKDLYNIQSKRKAITAFFPYAVWRERGGDQKMIDAFLEAVKFSGSTTSLWHAITPFISTIFGAARPRTVVLTSPHVSWHSIPGGENVVDMWATAVSEIQNAEGIEKGIEEEVVDTLLHIASVDSLRSHITAESVSWLKKQPTLSPTCLGRSLATNKYVVLWLRGLRDIEILKSYFLLVWSEWDPIGSPDALSTMLRVLSWDFKGDESEGHRKDLVKHLNRVLGELDRGSGYLRQKKLWIDEDDVQRAKVQYEKLKENLVGVDRIEPMEIPTCESPLPPGVCCPVYSTSWTFLGYRSFLSITSFACGFLCSSLAPIIHHRSLASPPLGAYPTIALPISPEADVQVTSRLSVSPPCAAELLRAMIRLVRFCVPELGLWLSSYTYLSFFFGIQDLWHK